VFINGTRCNALLDSGSMISTISDKMVRALNPTPEIRQLDNFMLSINVASGAKLPYLGYVEVDLKIPFFEKAFPVPLLVVSRTDYNEKVPIVIGTNVLNLCNDAKRSHDKVPSSWNVAMSSLCTDTRFVHSTNKRTVKLLPTAIKTVSGIVNVKNGESKNALTENIEQSFSNQISVCPRVVELKKEGKNRIPVRIYNMTAKVVEIKPKSILCGLNEVKVVRHIYKPSSRKRFRGSDRK